MTHYGRHIRTIGLIVLLAGCGSDLGVASIPASSAAATRAPGPLPSTIESAMPTAAPTDAPTAAATDAPTAAPTPGSAIIPGSVGRSSLAITATYDVALDVSVELGAVSVRVEIEARNDAGAPIDRLELNTIAARLGGLEVTEASVEDRPVSVTIDDQTLLVPLGGVLPDGASATVRLAYTASLARDLVGSNWLFSRAGETLALYRWIPWVSRAVPFDRPNHGDPFVTPSSPRVRVRLATDAPMVLASPGVAPVRDGDVWSFEARDVRDVAIALAPDFALTESDADGTPIRAYTRPGGLDGERLVTQASRAITRMEERLGVAYPWPALTIVETAGGYGMESPGLIWVPTGTAPGNLPYLVHHETAHQWFYGLVGNDQQAEPFADEAATDLLARTVLGTLRGSRCERAPLDRSIDRYSAGCYFEIVYIQGGNLLDDLRRAMGTDRFWAALGGYLEANRFGLGGTRQLLDALRVASPVDLLPTLRARFPSLY